MYYLSDVSNRHPHTESDGADQYPYNRVRLAELAQSVVLEWLGDVRVVHGYEAAFGAVFGDYSHRFRRLKRRLSL